MTCSSCKPREFPSWVVDWRSLGDKQYQQDKMQDSFFELSNGRSVELPAKRRGPRGEEIALKGRILEEPVLECRHEPYRDFWGTQFYGFRTSSGVKGISRTIVQSGD